MVLWRRLRQPYPTRRTCAYRYRAKLYLRVASTSRPRVWAQLCVNCKEDRRQMSFYYRSFGALYSFTQGNLVTAAPQTEHVSALSSSWRCGAWSGLAPSACLSRRQPVLGPKFLPSCLSILATRQSDTRIRLTLSFLASIAIVWDVTFEVSMRDGNERS